MLGLVQEYGTDMRLESRRVIPGEHAHRFQAHDAEPGKPSGHHAEHTLFFWTAHDGTERLHGVTDRKRDQGVPHNAHARVHRQALANVLLAEDESHVASYAGMDIGNRGRAYGSAR